MKQARTFFLGLLFSIGFLNPVSSQVRASFFAVHCDPLNAVFWPNLEAIVDSANAYNVPLTIMMTPPWADSVYNNPIKALKLAEWQSQGHEVGYHHHGITARNKDSWDGYTNATDKTIIDSGLMLKDKIGDMDDFMAFMEPLTGDEPYTTGGIATESEWPQGLIYRANGLAYDETDVFSMISHYAHNESHICGLTYANVDSAVVEHAISEYTSFSSEYYAGLVTHAKDFATDIAKNRATMKWFRHIANATNKKTVRQIMMEGSCALPRFQYSFRVTRDTDALLNTIVLRLNGAEAQKIVVRIRNELGDLVSTKHVDITAGVKEIDVSTKKLGAGTYSIELSSDRFKIVEPLVIE